MSSATDRARRTAAQLKDSQLFQDYQRAFRKATGLPLAIRSLQSYESALSGAVDENQFCALIGKTNVGCANCLKMQEQLEREAGLEPKSLHCFAGLCDTAVPIRVGDRLIAFLQTGQILLHQPNEAEFSQATRQILKWGAEINLKELEEAYYNTKVFDRDQYQAMVALLTTFAEHLATISNSIALEESNEDPMLVANAKKYIQERYQDALSLDDAAKAVNASTRHFCKVFKEATDITFTDYLARIRVEKAKHLLANLNLRVSEIAFGVGFESISQFNRSFKRVTGQTPTEFRRVV
ncbi:PocR ligand-binding domain-containing protein [Cerasicoccus arenae]|uniref:PocR ligand-binding domain-containing protein n=1 Tax=Cerasicoccus arenae TaxID=424488 RepID=UPI001E5E7052|nr:PocR ligand-binding domain-containing protein [Cerasicoccus arenae]